MTATRLVFWISTDYATAAVETDTDGVVVEAAPIFRERMMGKRLNACIKRLRATGHPVEWVKLATYDRGPNDGDAL